MDVSWVIPTYRDEQRIERTLREVDDYLQSRDLPGGYEIVVVGSRSGDRTPHIVERVAAGIPAIRLLMADGHGKGWSVRTGMLGATGAVRLFSDADNASAPRHFDRMRPLLQNGHQVVIGSRHADDAPGARRDIDEPRLRRIGGMLGNTYIRLAAGVRLRDTQNGFKGFTANAADDLFSRLTIRGFAFDVELLMLAAHRGYRVGVIPIEWRHDSESSITASAYFQVLSDVTRMGVHRLMGGYGRGAH